MKRLFIAPNKFASFYSHASIIFSFYLLSFFSSCHIDDLPQGAFNLSDTGPASNNKRLSFFQEHQQSKVTSVAFSSDGKHVVSSSDDGKVLLWSRSEKKILKEFSHQFPVISVDISPDGKYVFSGTKNGTISKWKISTERLVRSVSFSGRQPTRLEAASDGQTLLVYCSSNAQVKLLDSESLESKGLQWPALGAVDVSFDGKNLVIVGGYRSADMTLIPLGTGEEQSMNLFGHGKEITSVDSYECLREREVFIASGSVDGTLRLWRKKDGKQILELLEGYDDSSEGTSSRIIKVKFLKEGGEKGLRNLIAAYFKGDKFMVSLWDINHLDTPNKILSHSFSVNEIKHLRHMTDIDIDAHGRYMVTTSSDGEIGVWDIGSK